MTLVIREWTDADWPAVHRILRAVFDAGESYVQDASTTEDEARALWTDARTVVAVDETGAIVGTAHMGTERPGRGSHIATASFMVSPDARGGGIGRALGEDMVAWARAAGYRGIRFNAVVETNAGAVRLWQSLGFGIVGTVPGAFRRPSGEHVGLHVMFRALD